MAALDYLHGQKPPIIHRDLKCDNVLINGHTGDIRLGDFGLAVPRTQLFAQTIIGTPPFVAPEVWEEKYTEKVDVRLKLDLTLTLIKPASPPSLSLICGFLPPTLSLSFSLLSRLVAHWTPV